MTFAWTDEERAVLEEARRIAKAAKPPEGEVFTDWFRNNLTGLDISLGQILREPRPGEITMMPGCRCETDAVFTDGRCSEHAAMVRKLRDVWGEQSMSPGRGAWNYAVSMTDFQDMGDWSFVRDADLDDLEELHEYVLAYEKGAR